MVSDQIFVRMRELGMTQKEFSNKSGIPESTVSDWKHKGASPSADKLMMICNVLQVSPYFLLGGSNNANIEAECYMIEKDSNLGLLVEAVSGMNDGMVNRMIGYAMAMSEYGK